MSVPEDARKFLRASAKALESTEYSRVISEDIFTALDMPEKQAAIVIRYLFDAGYITDIEMVGNIEYPIMFRISAAGYDWLDY